VIVFLHHGDLTGAKPEAEVVADILPSIEDAKGLACS
jgi:hypothetical protein